MKAPIYQHQDLLTAALQTAVLTLPDPVEGVQMTPDGVVAWSGSRCILLDVGYNNDTGDDGVVAPGSGHWSARYVRDCPRPAATARPPFFARLVALFR